MTDSPQPRRLESDTPFLDEDGGGYIVCDDRRRAARMIRDADTEQGGEEYPISSYTVRRCYLRPAVEGDWVLDEYESGAMVCERDHPDAVPAWSVLP